MNRFARFLQDLYYRLFAGVIAILGGLRHPRRCYALASGLGELRTRFGYIGRGWSKKRYLNTIGTFFPDKGEREKELLLRSYWINHQKKFVELFLVRGLDRENLPVLVEFDGLEHLDRALERGKGVILPVPHVGNERLHHIALAVKGYPMAVISSQYKDHGPYARKIKLDASRRFHDVGHPGDVKWLLKMLRENKVLQVASDAQADGSGVLVELLGRRLLLPTGWVRLAQMTGAAVFPSALLRQADDRHRLVILPEFELSREKDRHRNLEENVQRYMDTVSRFYRQRPDLVDWMNLTVRLEETEALR